MRDLACDVISLAELQGKLFVVDLREGKSRVIRAGIILIVGPVLILAALPVLMIGLAGWISEEYDWSVAAVQLAMASAVVAVGGLVVWRGWLAMSQSFETLTRSTAELSENVRWIKSALRSPSPSSGDRSERY